MSDLEDIRAEAELRYLQLGRQLENPEGWKRIVARNLFIDQQRRKQKYKEIPLSESNAYVFDDNEDANNDKRLYTAIASLPEKQRTVILYRLNKKKFKEIASEMNISINTALGLYRYAVLNLRKIMNAKQ